MHRFVAAYILKDAAGDFFNALREKHDGRSARALPTHLTMAGPFNSEASWEESDAVLKNLSASLKPVGFELTRMESFLPVSATIYATVQPDKELTALNAALLSALDWQEAFPFCPHVTVAEYLPYDETAELYEELRHLPVAGSGVVDRIDLLEKLSTGRWVSRGRYELQRA